MPDSSPFKQPRGKQADSASDLDFPGAGDSDGDDESDVEAFELRKTQSGTHSKTGTPARGTAKLRIPTTPKRLSFPKNKAGSVRPQSLQGGSILPQRPTAAKRQQRSAPGPPALGSKMINKTDPS